MPCRAHGHVQRDFKALFVPELQKAHGWSGGTAGCMGSRVAAPPGRSVGFFLPDEGGQSLLRIFSSLRVTSFLVALRVCGSRKSWTDWLNPTSRTVLLPLTSPPTGPGPCSVARPHLCGCHQLKGAERNMSKGGSWSQVSGLNPLL